MSEAGVRVHRFSQSWLNTFLTCPERARLSLLDTEEHNTDATLIGTSVHAGIEAKVEDRSMSQPDMIERAQAVLIAGWHECEHVQVKTLETALKHVAVALDTWYDEVWPQLGSPLAVEHRFDRIFDERDGIQLRLTGTIDYVDESGIWDWKTVGSSKSKYELGWGGEGWKLQRFAVQATVYTWAWHQRTGDIVPFTYVALPRQGGDAMYVPCERSHQDWEWLRRQLWSIVPLLEANISPWPANDQHGLCSAKWCDYWHLCKGAVNSGSSPP